MSLPVDGAGGPQWARISPAGARVLLLVSVGGVLLVGWGVGHAPASGALAAAGSPSSGAGGSVVGDTISFRHDDHVSLDCQNCHANGRATVRAPQEWCAACHHQGEGFSGCGNCHTAGTLGRTRTVDRSIEVAGREVQRRMPFDHGRHSGFVCGECHTGALMPTARAECASCHESHHVRRADCTACHRDPPQGAHTLAVHIGGCGGAGCHVDAIDSLRGEMHATRSVCLACHQAQVDHEPGKVCTNCHLLPGREDGAVGQSTSRSGLQAPDRARGERS